MAVQAESDRWQEIRGIHQEYAFGYRIGASVLLVVVGVLIGSGIFAGDVGFQSNVYTEVLSVIVTILVLDKLAERREENRRIKDLKAQLVRDAGSTSNEAAKRAIDELRAHGWLTGSEGLLQQANLGRANLERAILEKVNLQGAHLFNANLQGAILVDANLQRAQLSSANLQGAGLEIANLQGAHLFNAKLQGAGLAGVNLQGADLSNANLQRTHLFNAKLQGADLRGVNLQGAMLMFAKFENTRLPDGTVWTPDADLTRFTNPNHPEFWRSDDPFSPAYHDKADAQ